MKLQQHVDSHAVIDALRREATDWRAWAVRLLVMAFAALTGLAVVAFTALTEHAFGLFLRLWHQAPWLVLVLTPACAALVTWLMRRWALGSAGSGIPQVIAAMDASVSPAQVGLFVSLRLTLAKIVLVPLGLLGGLSLGREGPSVQIAAGVMHHARHWLPKNARGVSTHGLMLAGGAAGIAAAFNTPLGGVMFAIEELSRRPEQRASGLLMAAIVLSGLMAVSVYGNATYFGRIQVQDMRWALLLPALLVALLAGGLGGLFARVLLLGLRGDGADRFSRWRRERPVAFAAGCGLGVAALGLASHGAVFGTGYAQTRALLEGQADASALYVWLKFVATWLTAWSGVPGGIFAPALSIGAGLGYDVALIWPEAGNATLIALGMAAFLAAVTQAPLTAFIIVMEMVDGYALVLSLMASCLVASGVSRLITPALYSALAQLQLRRLPPDTGSTKVTPRADKLNT
ncbi:MAG: chloride channel protein [Rhodoferax sp.]